MAKQKVLIVEDDQALAEVLEYNLNQAGYHVQVAKDGRQGLQLVDEWRPELILLDLMLPLVDGTEVCRRVRSQSDSRDTLILMLTAKAEESDQVLGFSLGADDYVTKPFSVKVLLERVAALFRRHESHQDEEASINSQGVTVDRRRHKALAGDEHLNLTHSEFRLLDVLVRQPGRAFTRSDLIDAVLGDDSMVMERTIDVHIRSLRSKLKDYAGLIETVRGVGYRFAEPEVAEQTSSEA